MHSIHSKLPDVGTTIFTVMSSLAQQYNAINLGQGFPDFPMPQPLIEAVSKAMNDGYNQYAHTNGLNLLRQKISGKIQNLYGVSINAETEITVTPGATYAIYTALTSILNKGDEVIVFEPAYDSYVPNILVNGAVPVFISLQYPDFSIDWNEVRRKISHKTKAIIINSPHNPTGSVLSEEDMNQLSEIVQDTDIIVLSDEVYEHLVFDNKQHQSILKYPELMKRSFACFSFGKTYHCTGWKMGYCIAGESLMREFRKVHQFNAFSTNAPMQAGLAVVLDKEDMYLSLGKEMQQKRDYFSNLMKESLFAPLVSSGSYFQCFSYAGFSTEPDKELAIRLVKEHGVACIPLSAFYQNNTDHHVLRFCFAKRKETLQNAAEKLVMVK